MEQCLSRNDSRPHSPPFSFFSLVSPLFILAFRYCLLFATIS
jgi:hypothetical protein